MTAGRDRLHLAAIAAAALLGSLADSARAEEPLLHFEDGAFELRAKLGAATQLAMVDNRDSTAEGRDYTIDARARLDASWTALDGTKVGARIDLTNRDGNADLLDDGEAYAFASTAIGRFELGLQDGPADTLALAAPVIALGQVRGDFSRYAGSRALLKPLDTRDSFKLVYLSPKLGGWRAGVSWSPRVRQDQDAEDPKSRILLRDAFELGVQYRQSIAGWDAGISGSYAFGKADPITTRADLNSWSVGIAARRGPLRIGGAIVGRGDSNRLDRGFGQYEINGGLGWIEQDWGLALSGARTKAAGRSNSVLGLGGFLAISPLVQIRGDIVGFREKRAGRVFESGLVGLIELQIEI